MTKDQLIGIKDQLIGIVSVVVFTVAFFRFLNIWIFELRFYRERNWDFNIDSKYSGAATQGDIVVPNVKGRPLSNRARVLLLVPSILIGSALAVPLSAYLVFNG